MKKLEQPRGLVINFSPSPKQYKVWKALQGGVCDKCGGPLELRVTGYDKEGHPIHEPICAKCGNTDIPELILAGGSAGGGKQMSLDSHVCTPNGFCAVRDLKVGDTITNPNTGKEQKIIYLHPITECEYYRIEFIDRTYSECSEEHLWRLHKARSGAKENIWTAKQIYEYLHNNPKPSNLIIPLTEPVEFSKEFQKAPKPIHPYTLGVLIGNGCLAESLFSQEKTSITSKDKEVVDRIAELDCPYSSISTKKGNQASSYMYYDKDFINRIAQTGIGNHKAETKFIPEQYKYFSIEDRKMLLQGLIDTDGYVNNRGHISYCTVSKQLAEDVAFIVRSLGGKATITTKQPYFKDRNGNKKAGKLAYNVWIMTKCDRDIVWLERKRQYARNEFNGGASILGKRIISCEPIGKKIGRCITVDDPSGLYVADNFTVTHNSYLGCAWVVSSCLKYPGIRMVLARKELKNLIATTWSTMLNILNEWGLVQDVNYHINNQRIVLTFWNGSTIIGLELSPSPNDLDFNRLGSLEISGAFCDEVSEISEKAIEVLQSRIRYKIAESFIVGKMLMSTNPCLNWVRSTFVMDDDGNPVKLPKGLRYLPFSLFDNPNEQFRIIYFNRLRKIRDKATRDRLLYGNWEFTDSNKMAAYHAFDGEKHLICGLTDKYFNPMKTLILSIDFNINPQMSALPIQIDYNKKEVYIFKEIVGKPEDGLNNTPAFSRYILKYLKGKNQMDRVLITGDPSGAARSTQTEAGTNNFTIIEKTLKPVFRTSLQIFNTQPSQGLRLDFINELLNGYNGWKIMIDLNCRKLTADLVYQKRNPDGTKEKKKVLMDNGVRAEQYGHLSDCLDYALCYYLNEEYNKFINGEAEIVTTSDTGDMYDSFSY